MADANAPPAKKATKGKAAAAAKKTRPAASKVFKYSDPSTLANQEPVDVTFLMWPKSEEEEEEEEEEDDDSDDDKAEVGPLQAILDGFENEREKAYSEAFDSFVKEKGIFSGGELIDLRKKVSAPFEKRADVAREEAVRSGRMKKDEAKAIKGISDKDRKEKRKNKRMLQDRLNEIQRERNTAVHEALNKGGPKAMTVAAG
ncbi:uncharacterized protein LY89DRAFT_742861 [Mollisia scopiformis]|uniref:Uncharacterized protein n=1 Tax=Mollisia scopiformis TaxID=149040 RepID=A0A132B5V2_MOLSC|nr:uncharacterized protein LY89DRAFT_742861 [Mollisia scopiformis]KUJ07633.1 hypothetical protein LY89DRAFT_742861 [Mollisia scopiformis]